MKLKNKQEYLIKIRESYKKKKKRKKKKWILKI